jgi:DNA-binding transcriptional MerR regulator
MTEPARRAKRKVGGYQTITRSPWTPAITQSRATRHYGYLALDIPVAGRSTLARVKVSELARRSGTTTKAIRFYEAEGVLPAPPRAPNGYREYGAVDLCRTRVLVALRNLGINLPESGRLASLCAADRCDEMALQLIDVVRERRAAVAAARAELDHLEGELAQLEVALEGSEPKTNLCLGKEVIA